MVACGNRREEVISAKSANTSPEACMAFVIVYSFFLEGMSIMPNVMPSFSYKSIKVFGGLAQTRYLSCDPDRSKIGVYLANRDTDPNQSQKWSYIFDFASSRSQIVNCFNDRYLTRYKDDVRRVTLDLNPASVDMITWGFVPLGNNTFNIYGVTNGTMYFLSCQDNGFVVDMYDHDDGSGRQRWVIDGVD